MTRKESLIKIIICSVALYCMIMEFTWHFPFKKLLFVIMIVVFIIAETLKKNMPRIIKIIKSPPRDNSHPKLTPHWPKLRFLSFCAVWPIAITIARVSKVYPQWSPLLPRFFYWLYLIVITYLTLNWLIKAPKYTSNLWLIYYVRGSATACMFEVITSPFLKKLEIGLIFVLILILIERIIVAVIIFGNGFGFALKQPLNTLISSVFALSIILVLKAFYNVLLLEANIIIIAAGLGHLIVFFILGLLWLLRFTFNESL